MRVLLILSLGLLAGCASTPVQELSYTELKAVAAQIQQRCYDQGVPPNSPEYERCINQEVNRETSVRQARADRRRSAVVCNRVYYTVICN